MESGLKLLTNKQKKVYNIIESYIKEKGISPTVREIAEALGDKTPATVQGILNRMEQKGAIKRKTGSARSIQLVSEKSNYGDPVYIPVVKKLNSRTIGDITNIYNIEGYQPVPAEILHNLKDCFIISCAEVYVKDTETSPREFVLISRDCPIKNGDSVLALYKNHPAIREFFSYDEETVAPEGDDILAGETRHTEEEMEIAGKLIGKYTMF